MSWIPLNKADENELTLGLLRGEWTDGICGDNIN